MADRTISLKIKVSSATENRKAVGDLDKLASKWDQVFGSKGDKLVAERSKNIKTLAGQWRSLGREIDVAAEHFRRGFSSGTDSGWSKFFGSFSKGIDGARGKLLNLKTAFAATAVGGAAFWAGHALYEEGMQQVRTRNKLRREFGATGDNTFIEEVSQARNFKAGVQDDDLERALIPFAREAQVIEKGAQFRGMKKPLTEEQATALRRKNMTFAADLLQRQIALHSELEPEEIGKILSDALAGPQGARQLVGAFGLGRRATKFLQANERGDLYKMLSPSEQKRLGVTKKGQFAEQGDLVNLLLEKGGDTNAAFQAMQRSFGHQFRQIKAMAMGTIGDIGAEALDELTNKLGQGATAAERLQNYLKSDEGKRTLLSIKDAVVSIGSAIGDIAKKLPTIGAWLKEHETLVKSLALVYAGSKAFPALSGVKGGVSALAKWATPAAETAGAGLGGRLLTVGKMAVGRAGLVGLAGAAGYGVGTGIDYLVGRTTGRSVSDRLAGSGRVELGAGEQAMRSEFDVGRSLAKKIESGKLTPEQASREFSAFVAVTEKGQSPTRFASEIRERLANNKTEDLSTGRDAAILLASQQRAPSEIVINTTLNLDGQTIARNQERHLSRDISTRTARGAAPASRE